jgi:hypothetical protein
MTKQPACTDSCIKCGTKTSYIDCSVSRHCRFYWTNYYSTNILKNLLNKNSFIEKFPNDKQLHNEVIKVCTDFVDLSFFDSCNISNYNTRFYYASDEGTDDPRQPADIQPENMSPSRH